MVIGLAGSAAGAREAVTTVQPSVPAVRPEAVTTGQPAVRPPRQPDVSKWEKTIAGFEKEDASRPFAPGGVVLTGSSSLARWKDVGRHFPGVAVLNRAFGGSTLPEVNHFLPRTVLKHKPATVVLFCGTNDLAGLDHTPQVVHANFKAFVASVREVVPNCRIIYISIHMAPGREKLHEAFRLTNALIRETCEKGERLVYLDLVPDMLGEDGKPNRSLYADPLHPTAKAYEAWAARLRPLLMPAAGGEKAVEPKQP